MTRAAGAATPTTAPPSRHLRLVRPPDTEAPIQPAAVGAAPSVAPATSGKGRSAPVQGTLALLFTLPGGAPAIPLPRRTMRLATYEPGVDRDHDDLPVPTSRDELPDPRRWTARLVQAAVEARNGDRPLAQLLRWTNHAVYDRIADDAALALAGRAGRRTPRRPLVRSLHVREPADGVVEACAVVEQSGRTRAIALRLEGLDGRWICTELEVL